MWDGVSEGGRAAARVAILLIYVTLIAMEWKEKLLPFEDKGGILYWGNIDFVEGLITAFESENRPEKEQGVGGFGIAYEFKYEGEGYILKKIRDDPSDPNAKITTKDDFIEEANAANELTARIPEYVSNLKGARWGKPDTHNYIIFELLEGKTLDEYLVEFDRYYYTHYYSIHGTTPIQSVSITKVHEKSTPEYLLLQEIHRNLSYLWCALEKSNLAMNAIGWSHTDIKPENLFYNVEQNGGEYDWSTCRCWLIDFGGAKRFGSKVNTTTRKYSACNNAGEVRNLCEKPLRGTKVRISDTDRFNYNNSIITEGTSVSKRYNAISRKVLWFHEMVYSYRDYFKLYPEFHNPLLCGDLEADMDAYNINTPAPAVTEGGRKRHTKQKSKPRKKQRRYTRRRRLTRRSIV